MGITDETVPLWRFNLLAVQLRDALHAANYLCMRSHCDTDREQYTKARDAVLRTLDSIQSGQPAAPVADEREAFEAWAREENGAIWCAENLQKSDNGAYVGYQGNDEFVAFKAGAQWQARAALQPAQPAAVPEGWLTSLRKAIDEYHAATVARCNCFSNDPQQWNRKRREQEAAENLNALLSAAAPQPKQAEGGAA